MRSRRFVLALGAWVVLALLFPFTQGHAQNTTVLEWTFGTSSYTSAASLKHEAVSTAAPTFTATSVSGFSVTQRGNSSDRFPQVGSWSSAETSMISGRTSYTPVSGARVFFSTFTMDSLASGDWSNLTLRMDYQRTAAASPTRVRAYLTWQDGATWRTAYSNLTTLSSTTGSWISGLNLTFPNGAAMPTNLAGEQFLLEIQFSSVSNSTNNVYVDDIKLLANSLTRTADFGDHTGFPAASQNISADIRIGSTGTDAEAATPTMGSAAGDDSAGADDEDLVMPTMTAGVANTLTVPVTVTPANLTGSTARLAVFADWNGDGDTSDEGEAPAVQTVNASGNYTFSLFPPYGTPEGVCYLRLRLVEGTTAPAFSGLSSLEGEVEDYAVTMVPSTSAPMGDYSVIASNSVSTTTDIQGRVITGSFIGTASSTLAKNLSNYASTMQAVQVRTSVVSGSPINLQYGSLYVPTTGALNGRTVNYNGGGSTVTTPAPDFDRVFNNVTNASAGYAGLTPNSTVTIPTSSPAAATLNVGVLGADNVAVFSVNGAQLLNNSNVQQIDLNLNGRTPSAVIINVTGVNVSYGASGNMVGNLTSTTWRNRILWNFPQATSISANKSISGSIMAPLANVSLSGGALEGSVACLNLSTTVEIKLTNFIGVVAPPTTDYGDHTAFPDAGQTASSLIRIGSTTTDAEEATPSAAGATGDDSTAYDDDDTVMPVLTAGVTGTLTVPVTVTPASLSGGTARLQVFADWNGDGDVDDSNETLAAQTVSASGSHTFSLTAPGSVSAGTKYLRIRLSESATAPGFSGVSTLLGEVEDHAITVNPPPVYEYGDSTAVASAWSDLNTALKIGVNVDSETTGFANSAATGDDLNGLDDEDGVVFPALVRAGMAEPVNVTVTNTTGAMAYLNAWMDFNLDGDFDDSGERVINNISVPTGTNNVTTTHRVLIADGAVVPNGIVARFRLTNVSNPSSVGQAGSGEVEDYAVFVTRPACDLTGATMPDFRTLTRQTSTTGIGWIPTSRPGTLSQTFMNWRGSGINATFNYSNNMWDANAPNVYVEAAQTGNTVHCAPLYWGALRFTNNTASTPAGTSGTSTGAARMEVVFSQPVWVDAFRVGGLSKVGSVWEWARVTAYGTDGAVIPPSSFLAGGSDCSGNPSPWTALVQDDGAGGSYVAGVDSQTSGHYNDVTFAYSRAAISRIVVEHWAGTSGSDPLAAHSSQQTEIAISGFCFTDAQPRMGIGNLVFRDTNLNGRHDSGEGVSNVRVRLFREGDDPATARPVAMNTTNSNGVYGFGGLVAGNYFVHVPASEFATGAPLVGLMSMAGTSNGDDNLGEDGLDAASPAMSGISSSLVSVLDNGEPINSGTETGAFNTSDDGDDNNTDLTVDMGFTVPMDFGDLMDSGTGTSTGNYRTLYSDSGPGHVINSRLKLGLLIDADTNGQPTANADGDDTNGSDDDDAIATMPAFITGQTTTIPVRVTNTTGVTAYLNGWLDLNNNGSFEDSGEKMTTVTVPNNTNNGQLNLSVAVSGSGVTGTPLGLRLRISGTSTLTSTGTATSGEVEDYAVILASPQDFGDFSGFESASSMVNSSLRIGTNATDSDTGASTNATATSDDSTGTDDEDGVTFPTLIPGQPGTISIRLSNSIGSTAHLGGWMDFNNDGVLDASEKVVTDTVTTGTSGVTRNYVVNVPPGSVVGAIGARFRLTSVSGAGPTGAAGSGEVEDYAVTISAPNRDSGDALSLGQAWSTANSNLRLGLVVDTEAEATLNATATGDDVTGNDDEDAVTSWPVLTAGSTATVSARVRNATGTTAYLNVWADWNGDGDLLDAGEQLVTNRSITTGTDGNISLSLAIPASAGAGTDMLRMRLTNSQNPGPTGVVGTGEVEDYQITTVCPAVTITPGSVAAGVYGAAYSQTLSATGGATPKTWAITAGSLPPGLTLGASTGVISGTPGAAGAFSFTVTSTDPFGCAGSQAYNLNVSSLAIGNLVWNDVNNNGVRDVGESGVAGAVVTLFSPGADNAIGGTGGNADTEVGSMTTTSTGAYGFNALAAGKYYVRVTPPATHPLSGGTAVTLDNRVDNDNNGSQPGGGGTDLFSPIIDLAGGAEPTGDGDSDTNTDLTVDFGLWSGFAVGNTVWNDVNKNGVRDIGEPGVSGVLVELFSAGTDNAIGGTGTATDLLVASTTTASGAYGLRVFTPGRYFLRLTPTDQYPAASTPAVTADNGVDDDNNGSQPEGEFGYIYSPVFLLSAGLEPGASGTTSTDNTFDFGLVASSKGGVGNLVFYDANNNGRYDGGDSGISGVTLQLVTSGGTVVSQTTSGGIPAVAGWAIQQASSSTNITNLSQADACLAGTNRTKNYQGTAAVVNFFGNGSDFGLYGGGSLMPDGSGDHLAFRATGTISIPVTGEYTFGINTDAGGRLRIDGNNVITDAGPHLPTTVLATVTLSAGLHSIEFTGYESTGGEGFEVFASPGAFSSITSVDTGSFGTFRLVGDTANGGLAVSYPGNVAEVGRYRFNNVLPGTYYVNIPASQFLPGGPLAGVRSFIQSTAPVDDQRDDNSVTGSADSGVDDDQAELNGIKSHLFTIALGTEPTAASGEAGFLSTEDDDADTNVDLTIDFAFRPTLSLGDSVWNDLDNDGVKDAGEPGVAGALVQLFTLGADNAIGGTDAGTDVQVGTDVMTNATGAYRFSGLAPGKYYVKVTPPSSHPLIGGTAVTLDNGVDNDNNGSQPGGVGTPLFSPILDLALGSEPTTDGDSDANTDLTVDFGVRVPTLDYGDFNGFGQAASTANSTLRMGLAVTDVEAEAEADALANGDDSTGGDDEDGVSFSGVLVKGLQATVTVKVTNSSGSPAYLNGWIDWNNNGLLTDGGEQIITSRLIATGTNGADQVITLTVPAGAATGAVGARFRLSSVQTPGPVGTVGVGEVEDHLVQVAPAMTLGNLIWNDANDNGIKDASESGVNNILVELWSPGADNAIGGSGAGADTRVASTTTAGGGLYSFGGVPPGAYYVKVPTPPFSKTSTTVVALDNGVDNDNNGTQPGGSGTSAFSPVIQLTPGLEPGNAGGGNVDNSVDFGFVSNIGSPFVCDNRFYIMQNAETSAGSGVWDSTIYYIADGPALEPVFVFTGKKLNGLASYGGYLYCVDQNDNHLYRINSLGTLVDMGAVPGLPIPGTSGQWSGATALTNGRMVLNYYQFSPNQTVLYTIDLATASLVGGGVTCVNSATGAALAGNFGDIAWDPTTGKLYGYNTVETSWLGLFEINASTGSCTRVASSSVQAFGSLVIDANGLAYGYGGRAGVSEQDTLYLFNRTGAFLDGSMTAVGSGPLVANSDGAACPGAPPSMKIGSHVWHDVNNNGVRDAGESGIDGVTLQLFYGGQNPATATPLASTTSANGGQYAFSNLPPGQYFVYLPTPPAAYPVSSAVTDTADNQEDNDDNGIQTAAGQPVRSPMIALAAATEPVNDGDTDNNSDLTIDFGLLSDLSIGNLVWSDTNNNGIKEASEPGISSLTVQLYTSANDIAGDADDVLYAFGTNQVLTTASGLYSFTNLRPGKYVVRVTPPTGGVTSGTPDTADNSQDNDNNGSQPGGVGTAIFSPVITLTPGGESIADGDTSVNSDNTVDFGIFTGITVGNLVWNDLDNDGVKDGAEAGLGSVSLALMNAGADNAIGGVGVNADTVAATTTTGNGGAYTFTVYTPGRYYIAVTPTATMPAASSVVVTLDNGVDNDNNGSQPGGQGTTIFSPVFQLTAGGEPGGSGTGNTEGTLDFGLRGCPAITISPTSLPAAVVGTAYSATLSASGGDVPYTFAVASGALPAGLTLNASTGVISGTPTSTTPAAFTIRAADAAGCTGTRAFSLTPTCPEITFNQASAPAAVLGTAYSQSLAATGGTAPYTYSVSAGRLPAGLVLNTTSGSVTGTPTGNSEAFTLRAQDAYGCSATRDYVLSVACPVVDISPASLPAGQTGTAFSASLSASPSATYAWSVANGSLPLGLNLNAATGQLSGTPSGVGASSFTVRASTGPAVLPVLEFSATTLTLNPGQVFNLRNYVRVKDAPSTPLDWSQISFTYTSAGANNPTSPADWNLASFNAGVPVAVTSSDATAAGNAGTGRFRVYIVRAGQVLYDDDLEIRVATGLASDMLTAVASPAPPAACSGTRAYGLVVCSTISLSPATLTAPTVGTAYSQTISATGGVAPYTYALASGNLPAGLSLSSTTGAVTGTATSVTSASFVVRATDVNGCSGTRAYSLSPVCPGVTITPTVPAAARAGSAYSQTMTASGGTAPYTWAVASGTLPAGLTLSAGGVVSGTPTASNGAGVSVTVRATDANGCQGNLAVVFRVCPVITLSPTTLAAGVQNLAYSQTISASGAANPVTYMVSGGSLPSGLTLNSGTGVISGTPTAAGSFAFIVAATDANGCQGTRSFSLTITNISVGSLVWDDLNSNGLKDSNEPGVANVPVELVATGADNAMGGTGVDADTVYASTTTNSSGVYGFSSVPPGRYYVRILPPKTHPLASTVVVTADNGVDNDNNGTQTGGPGGAITSPVIQLAAGTEPGVSGTTSSEQTIDFGITIGNSIIWLIDEDYTLSTALRLWSFKNYRSPSTTATDYGRLKYRRPSDGAIRDIADAGDIESMAVNRFTGDAYILSSDRISGSPSETQSLWTYNLNDAPANVGNIVLTLIGHIRRPTNGAPMECLAYDPISKRFYTADPKDNSQNSSTTTDRLYSLNIGSLNSNVMLATNLTSVGDITGLSNTNRYVDGLEFSVDGKLYSVDGTDDDVYEISPSTGAIIGVTDTDIAGGAGGSVDVETMAWDEVSDRLIAVDNSGRRFIEITRGSNGSNISIASFVTGVPGMPSSADLEASAMYDTHPPRPRMTLGNAVFLDANFNGRMDAGEGVDGVAVELYEEGDVPGVAAATAVVTTSGGGLYQFKSLLEETYFVHIPARNFAPGGPLYGFDSVPGTTAGDDNAGEDGVDNANPASNGISSAAVELLDNAEPVNSGSETGFRNTDDDEDDNNGDLTVDFGFRDIRMALGNQVWLDVNNNGLKEGSEPGLAGVTVQLYTSTDAVAGNGDDALYTAGANQVVTAADGTFAFTDLRPGSYALRVATPAGYLTSGTPVGVDNGVNNDNNGSQPGGVGGVVFSPVITLAPNTEPTLDGDSSSNTDLSVDFGLFPGITLGDLVWNDANNNGVKDTAETGVASVTVELFSPGADNAIGGTGGNADTLVATTTTNSSGSYSFLTYTGGRYYVRVTPTVALPAVSSLVDIADNAEDGDNNGSQPGGQGNLIFSPVIQLTAGGEPGTTGTGNAELTLDFGLRSCPAISLTPTSLATPTVGAAYSQSISASGGVTPYAYSVSSGSLPAGLSLNPTTGLLSGTPSSPVAAAFVVRVVDASGCAGSRSYSLTPACPVMTVSPSVLPLATVGTAYSQTLSVTGGAAPFTWSVSAGVLPSGLSLSTGGVLAGTPSAANGTGSSITFRVVDSTGCAATLTANVQVCGAVALSPGSLAAATVGTAYSQSVTASGGTAPYTYALASGSLPAGLSLGTSTGAITGTPSSSASASFTVRATDAAGCVGTRAYTLAPACPSVSVTTTSLPTPILGSSYSQTVSASGGTAPYTWSVSAGALPAGLNLNGSTGSITGTATSSTAASFTLRVVDAFGCAGTRAFTMTPGCPTLSITSTSLTTYLSFAGTQNLAVTGGTAPYTWAITSGSLPAGLSLSSAGVLSGTPTALGGVSVGVRVTDTYGCQATQSVTVTVKGLTLGNRVWLDRDNDGMQDVGEPGVAGAVVQLMNPGTDNAVGGTGGAADVQVGSAITTDSTGAYSFSGLAPGNYYVRVTPPANHTHTSGTPVSVDNNVDGNNDGSQPGGPGTALLSPVIALQPGAESTSDGDGDPDTNLTVDFGLWAGMGVGSMAFLDLTDDGVHTVNEGVEFVFVQLFAEGANVATDEPATATLTGKGGRFLLMDVNPGRYFLHVPASEFAAGALLEGRLPVRVVIPGDDDVGQDLVFNDNPSVNGASTAVFDLMPGQAPVGAAESGFEGVLDDEGGMDANIDLTRDLGFLAPSPAPAPFMVLTGTPSPGGANGANPSSVEEEESESTPYTFVQWQAAHPLAGINGALDNPDGDLYANLLEYAFDTAPDSGAEGAGRFVIETDAALGTVGVRYVRPTVGRDDLAWQVEVSADLATWAPLGGLPATSIDGAGRRVVRFAAVDSAPALAGSTTGFLRLKVSLDADLNGTPEAVVTTPVQSFSRQPFAAGTRTFSLPLAPPEVYAGAVLAVEGSNLRLPVNVEAPPGASQVEVLDGPQAGRWLEVDPAASGSGRIALRESAHGITPGVRVAWHALPEAADVFAPDAFTAGTSADSADRLLFHDAASGAFRVVWLSAQGWVAADGGTVPALAPGLGLMVHVRTTPQTVLVSGQVPARPCVLSSMAGSRLVGTGAVVALSPRAAGLVPASGFAAGADAAGSTRLRLWQADTPGGSAGYEPYYLLAHPAGARWVREGDSELKDVGGEALLAPFHAFFLVHP